MTIILTNGSDVSAPIKSLISQNNVWLVLNTRRCHLYPLSNQRIYGLIFF